MASASDRADAVANGGAEEGAGGKPIHWSTWAADEAVFCWDSQVRHAGKRSLKIAAKRPTYACWSQNVSGLKPARLYTLSAWIRTEGVKARQKYCGAYLVTVCKGRPGKDLGTWYSPETYATQDWRRVTHCFATVPGTETVTISCVLKGSKGAAWFDDICVAEDLLPEEPPAPPALDGTPVIEVATKPNPMPLDAFGVEWDPHLWRESNRENGVGKEDRELIRRRIRAMRIRKMRMGTVAIAFEPENDNDDPAVIDWNGFRFEDDAVNDRMYSLYRHLDVCEEFGISVTIAFWPVHVRSWLGLPNGRNWGGAPNSLEEAAENISALLQHLKNRRQYTCLRELILHNEPNHDFFNGSGAIDFDYFADYCQTVHKRLEKDGLRDGIALVGSDDGFSLPWFRDTQRRLDRLVDKYDSHMYRFDADTASVGRLARLLTAARASIVRKPFFYGEFGTGHTSGPNRVTDLDTFERGLFLAVHAVNSLKAGASGACYWVLHDMYYKRKNPKALNGGLMGMGLWAYKDKNWTVRPSYHAYALLTRYTVPGSRVFDVRGGDESVDGVALLSPQGQWAYLVTNRSRNHHEFVLRNSHRPRGELARHLYSRTTLPSDDSIIPASGRLRMEEGLLRITVPSRSFLVLTESE